MYDAEYRGGYIVKVNIHFRSIFAIGFPWLIVAFVYYNSLITEKMQRMNISYLALVLSYLPILLLFALLLHLYIINKNRNDTVFLCIGFIELLLMLVPSLLNIVSYALFSILMSNLQVTLALVGMSIIIYLFSIYLALR